MADLWKGGVHGGKERGIGRWVKEKMRKGDGRVKERKRRKRWEVERGRKEGEERVDPEGGREGGRAYVHVPGHLKDDVVILHCFSSRGISG